MSRLAKKPLPLPRGVEVKKENNRLVFSGPKGTAPLAIFPGVTVETVDGALKIKGGSGRTVGLFAALVRNAIEGVNRGFRKELELSGVGYKAVKDGDILRLSLGFSHPVEYQAREGVLVTVEGGTRIVVEGIDSQQVGQVAAEIRRHRPPEPYKGKGIRYIGEVVRRKSGKVAKASLGAKA